MEKLKTIGIWFMVGLVWLCGSYEGNTSSIGLFFNKYGLAITLLVCAVWVIGGLAKYKEEHGYKVGSEALGFALLIIVVEIGRSILNYETRLKSSDDMIVLAAEILLAASCVSNLLKENKNKK